MMSTRKTAVVDRATYRIEALAKGLGVLSLFSEQRPAWRISDISTATGMPLPTTYRVVMTLVGEGYLEQLANGDYRPGIKVLTLGTAALHSLDLVDVATPRLRALADHTGETVNMAVLSGDHILYVVRLRNRDLVTANIQVGSRLPAVTTSIGKVLLAYLADDDLASRLDDTSFVGNRGPNAKQTMEQLRPQLTQIRGRGWASQDEEVAHGLRSVAAPVWGREGGVIAGINIAVQARDWTLKRIQSELQPAVLAAAEDISRLLGHRP